jgi:hypothetical protein
MRTAPHCYALVECACGRKHHECREGLGAKNEARPIPRVGEGLDVLPQAGCCVLDNPLGFNVHGVVGEAADAVRVFRFIGAAHGT